jgi:2-polyprenyl-6-hydroxyphenyl methylase/3-demethylubiquinone-9 3-methyltransferase
MPIGPTVRALFGKHERRIADLYRGLFMNLADYGAKVGTWAPHPRRILEVGCGEGAVTEILAETFADAAILAIDITPRAGRLYRGRRERVEFREATVQSIAGEQAGAFDLIVLSDVMHHIPDELRGEVLAAIGRALAPGGRFILKDWSKSATPIHWLCHGGDRWLTGDRVAHLSPSEAKLLVAQHVPGLQPVGEGRIRPWRNNYALVFAC